ncbi:TetR/AcrR family transcriptional regulator [Amycolatopsis nigrescens]|uniref:TetR/AcrR family transcriptional regulator n=1 Tax=Amycolatopsis nigrescens TaxID=381445 RepID=UPI001B7F871E|nr:TetR/AcrR family transcriptional regulator [Amycolatopsis nigrescens]
MTVGTTPGRRRAEHLGPDRRRPQVLDSALTIAVEQGVSAVSMTAVAERMGVTKPVVYACFATRHEILAALLEREERRLLDGVLAALPEKPSFENPKRLLIEGFQALFQTVAAQPDSWRILFAAGADPAISERFGRARSLVADRVAELMRPALVRWGSHDIDRKLPALVEIFMGAGEGAVRALLQSGDTWTTDELGEFVGKTVFGALRNA